MSDDQDGCEWVNVSSGVVQVVPDKGQLNGRLCVVYVTVGRPSVCLSVCPIDQPTALSPIPDCCANMASSIRPHRPGISRRRQSRTEPRPWVTRADNLAEIARAVLEICSQDCRLICSELAVNGDRSGQVLPAGECVCNVVSTTPRRCRHLPSVAETNSRWNDLLFTVSQITSTF